MDLKHAQDMAFTGEPMTKSEYQAAYSALANASYRAAVLLCYIFVASLIAVIVILSMGLLNGWIITGLVLLNVILGIRAGTSDAHVKFLMHTANVIWT